jgi:hypothetical protein
MHPLLRQSGNLESVGDDAESINLTASMESGQTEFESQDEDVLLLVEQIRQHVANMQTNSDQVKDIGEAVANTRLALAESSVLSDKLPQLGQVIS